MNDLNYMKPDTEIMCKDARDRNGKPANLTLWARYTIVEGCNNLVQVTNDNGDTQQYASNRFRMASFNFKPRYF